MMTGNLNLNYLQEMGLDELITLDKEIKESSYGQTDLVESLQALILNVAGETEQNLIQKILNTYEFLLSLHND